MNSAAFLTMDWARTEPTLIPGGCAYYRSVLPSRALRAGGWATGIGLPWWDDERGFGLLYDSDHAIFDWPVVQLKLVMLEVAASRMAAAQALGQRVVVDVDDYFEGLADTNLAKRLTDPSRSDLSNRTHYLSIIDQADALTVSTPFLQEFYAAQGKTVYMVRNGIDLTPGRWTPRRDHSGWMPTVGWMGSTPWRSGDLQTLSGFLDGFMRGNRLTFHHAGHIKRAAQAKDQLGLTGKVTTEGTRTIDELPRMFRHIDIGLVPLSDVPFNHAKSCLKGLEYAAAGVPFVASALPEYQRLADMGCGRVASTPDEWIGHLEDLLDPAVRAAEVARNTEALQAHTMDARGHEWLEAFRAISEK